MIDRSCGWHSVESKTEPRLEFRVAARVSQRHRRTSLIYPSISFSTLPRRSASSGGLSQRMRWMRGKRRATPDLWRVERCTASKATSKTRPGRTARTGPKRSVGLARIQDRKSVVEGKGEAVRLNVGGGRAIQKKKN